MILSDERFYTDKKRILEIF